MLENNNNNQNKNIIIQSFFFSSNNSNSNTLVDDGESGLEQIEKIIFSNIKNLIINVKIPEACQNATFKI